MKKAAFIFLFASLTSLVAAASNEVMAVPGDPKKEQQVKQPTFTLSSGYFSLFNIFSSPAPQADTTRTVTPVMVPQGDTRQKP